MKVLIGCESSGIVRDEFLARGHDAWSCDLLPSERPGPHYQGDVVDLLGEGWDLGIFHPECTYVAGSGLHWNRRRPGRAELTKKSLEFVRVLMRCKIPRWAIENPVGCIGTQIRPPDQIIQPWEYGEDASKATCLWLKNLPLLRPTNILPGGKAARRANQTASGQNRLSPSPERWKERARTYKGIAAAMAEQWGKAECHAIQNELGLF